MKNVLFYISICLMVVFTACETTQEITVNNNGSGVVKNTVDMSSAIGMIKQFAPQDTSGQKLKVDTSIALANVADSFTTLKADEKALVKKGNWSIKVNGEEEKFISVLEFPFERTNQINSINNALMEMIQTKLMDQMTKSGAPLPPGMDDKGKPGEQSSIDDYFDFKVERGKIEKKLRKEKYAKVDSDQTLMGLKNASGMGASVKYNYIINLPAAAKKVEGKSVKLSDDKKKVTIAVTSDDFFDDPSKFEYKVEY